MIRLLAALALALALVACSSPGAGPTPEATRALADSAAANGEAHKALALYKAAGVAGDLDALLTVARAMENGYIRAPQPTGMNRLDAYVAHHLPIFVLPGQAGRWRERYENEKNRQAAQGDPYARLRVAEDLTVWSRDETQADRDSAHAIRQRLVAEGFGPALIPEAVRLHSAGDSDGADSLLARARAPYDAEACALRVMYSGLYGPDETPDISARATAALIDGYEACPDLPGGVEKQSARIVRNLKRSTPPAYVGHLDSLRALGVFERHPRLAEV